MTTTLERQEKELRLTQEKLDRLLKQIAETKRRFTNDQAAIIDSLPKRLGLPNLEAVRGMIHAREKGELGSLVKVAPAPAGAKTSRPRVKFTPELKAKLDSAIISAAENHGTSKEVAALIGCSVAKVDQRKAELRKIAKTLPEEEPATVA